MTHSELNSETLENVSGGKQGYEESREIIAFFRSKGYDVSFDESRENLQKFLKKVLAGTKLEDYTYITEFEPGAYNRYFSPSGGRIYHEHFMQLLQQVF